jgi:hypothetical protein
VGVGLRNWLRNNTMTDPVPGTYRVSWRSELMSDEATTTGLECRGIVEADGVGPVEVVHRCMADSRNWPSAGQVLPVLVDRVDPTRLRIRWDAVGPRGELLPVPPPAPPTPRRPGPKHPQTGRPAPGTTGGGVTPKQAEKAQAKGGKYRSVTAVVTAVVDAPGRSRRAAGGSADLTLGFTLDGKACTATTRIGFRSPERRAQVAVPGNELPVLVDPRDPSRVVVDVRTFDRWHQQ